MGLTLDQLNSGVAGLGKILTDGMATINQVAGKTTATGTPTVAVAQTATPSAPATTAAQQSPAAGPAMPLPKWVWLAGGGLALWWLAKGGR